MNKQNIKEGDYIRCHNLNELVGDPYKDNQPLRVNEVGANYLRADGITFSYDEVELIENYKPEYVIDGNTIRNNAYDDVITVEADYIYLLPLLLEVVKQQMNTN